MMKAGHAEGFSEEGFKDTEHQVPTTNTLTDINAADQNAPNSRWQIEDGMVRLRCEVGILQKKNCRAKISAGKRQ
jgi:hypothetical protein